MWVGSAQRPAKAGQFIRAIEQVEKWRSDLQKPEQLAVLLSAIKKMMGDSPLSRNSFEVKYGLVYGRSKDLDTEPRREMYADLQKNTPIALVTFDNLVTAHANGITQESNVVRAVRPGPSFAYVYLNREPMGEFGRLPKETLVIGDLESEILRGRGYDIDAWKNGEMLVLNNKQPASAIKVPRSS